MTFDHHCRRCPRLAAFLTDLRGRHPAYHNAPVAPFGDPAAGLLIVGLAPGLHGANRTGRPFTGDHAGILLYATLHAHGLADRPMVSSATDGLTLNNCRITNAVKCVPPENRPTTAEIVRLAPGTVLLALGQIAHNATLRALALRPAHWRFAHGAEHALQTGLTLIDSYHCSRYNTQTGRLTAAMFDAVVGWCRELVPE